MSRRGRLVPSVARAASQVWPKFCSSSRSIPTRCSPLKVRVASLVRAIIFVCDGRDPDFTPRARSAAPPEVALDNGLRASLTELGGTTVSRSDMPFRGLPSIRVEHRGGDGVYVVRRVVAAHGDLIDIAVYAPSGHKPAWAEAFVGSLDVD